MDTVPIFQERIKPESTFAGIPNAVLFPYGILAALCFVLAYSIFGYFQASIWLSLAVAALGVVSLIAAMKRWYTGSSLLLSPAIDEGHAVFKRPQFAVKSLSFFETFCWRNPIDEHVLKHHDGVLSVMFEWNGQYNEFFSMDEFDQSMARYNQLVKLLAQDFQVTLELHFDRRHDDSAVDAYLRVGEGMDTQHTPRIVKDIRSQMANKLRGKGFRNKVYGVLSIRPPSVLNLKQLILKTSLEPQSAKQEACIKALKQAVEVTRETLDGFRLLSIDEYYQTAAQAVKPFSSPTPYNFRQCFSEQLAYDKPQWDEAAQCLKQGDTYIKPVLLFKYPELSHGWFFSLSNMKTCLHVSQIIQPKHASSVLNKTRKEILNKKVFSSEDQHNWDDTKFEISDAESYCDFIKINGAGVGDNCYIVVFYSDENGLVRLQADYEAWASEVTRQDGEVRCDQDLQCALYLYQAPGMGRYSRFFREDNGFAIGRMVPDTVYDAGDPNPEILRQCVNGQLFGYSPSKEVVLGQLIAGQVGGGKDSQFGLSLLETYQRINYTIFEEGNSYQAIVEALGGRYCEAVSQIINPLASFEDYRRVVEKEKGDHNFISGMRSLLLPIFKGFGLDQAFTREEAVVLDAALAALYETPIERRSAPILPDLGQALSKESLIEEEYQSERQSLLKQLRAFLRTSEGRPFSQEDQFVLSPIINAINFEGLSQGLLKYYLGFMAERVSMKAFASGNRSQVVINEYRTLMSKAPEAVQWVTLLLDRKGRKEWTGLSRITQGVDEVVNVDKESLSSIGVKSLLSRKNDHERLGDMLKMPESAIAVWSAFESPKIMDTKGYREMLLNTETPHTHWQYLKLEFPELLLDLMTTAGADKAVRLKALKQTKDVYERIRLITEGRKAKQSNSSMKEVAV
jgi:tetratricopeptide (TPR) repeat protein